MGLRRFIAERRSVYTDSPPEAWERDFSALRGLRTFAGKRVTQKSAQNLIAVYACQSLISDGISTLPIEHMRKKARDDSVEPVPRAQTPAWINRPNQYQTSVEFWGRVITSLLSDGNAFIYTLRDASGLVVSLYCLDPSAVGIRPGKFGQNTYTVTGINEPLDRTEILHIAGFVNGQEPRGLSPIDVAREAIGLGLTVEEFGARFFSQGVTMSGVIEHPGMPGADEAKLLRDMFRKTHGGTKNSHAVGILTGGAAFKPISIRPDQAQFLETRKFQKAEIALLYRVPAYLVDPGVTSSWGAGIEEQNKFLVEYTFMPWAIRIEQAVSTFLLPGGQFFKFNFNARLRAKTLERYEAYGKAIDAGFMNPDEARALEDLPPLPGGQGQNFWRPANMVPMKIALKPPEPKPEPKPEPVAPAPTDSPPEPDGTDKENDDDA